MPLSTSELLDRINLSGNGTGLRRLLEPLALRQPAVYRGLLTLFALMGYGLLLLFPLSALFLLDQLPQQLQTASVWQDWLWIGLDLSIALLAIILSVPLFFNRFSPPRGLELNRQNAPKLYQLVEQLRQEFKYPVVDQIIMQDGFRVEVVKTPRFGLPILFQQTLVIGIDAMLTLPPAHFKSLLARRIGQLSGIHNRYIGWLASLCQIWDQYHQALRQQKRIGALPLQLLFALYTPFYAATAFYAVRQNEQEGDRYALDIANDEEIASLYSQLIITEAFLQTRFWPKISQLARRDPASDQRPYTRMAQVLRRGLTREDMQNWIKNAFETTSEVTDPAPLLRQRLENMGHHKPASPRPLRETASDHFMDPGVMQKIIDKFDQRWLAKIKE